MFRSSDEPRRLLGASGVGVIAVTYILLTTACSDADAPAPSAPDGAGGGSGGGTASTGGAASGGSSVALAESLAALGLDRYLDLTPVSHAPNPDDTDWEVYDFLLEDLRCIDGSPQRISVRRGTVSSLAFVFDGGGACWPGQEACATTSRTVTSAEIPFPVDDPASPFTDWTLVAVPYCDGSVHTGDASADYDGDGVPDHWHWGLRSTSAAIALAREIVPEPERLFVTGCSAGGYGTIVANMVARVAFPSVPIDVFNDSGPGLFNPADTATWQLIRNTWSLSDLIPADCPECQSQMIHLYGWMLERDEALKVGLYSSYEDSTIGEAYLGMLGSDFRALLLAESGTLHSTHPDRFQRFFVEGTDHCVQSYATAVDGTTLQAWITAQHEGTPPWRDLLQ